MTIENGTSIGSIGDTEDVVVLARRAIEAGGVVSLFAVDRLIAEIERLRARVMQLEAGENRMRGVEKIL